jgi:trimethylamine--corrinoid protein Co-methyltransferase
MRQGLDFSEKDLDLDLIAGVGHGGSYMEQIDTFERMRSAAMLPQIAVRDVRGAWEAQGKSDAHTRALAEAGKILSRDNPAVFSAELDAEIHKRFKGLVAGDAGWD